MHMSKARIVLISKFTVWEDVDKISVALRLQRLSSIRNSRAPAAELNPIHDLAINTATRILQ